MPADISSDGTPSPPSPDHGEPTEPFLLESLLAEVRALRARSLTLVRESTAEAARRPIPAWQHLRTEVTSAHERADRALVAAARRDGLPPSAIEPVATPTVLTKVKPTEDPLPRYRNWARGLEQHCTSALGQAQDLGLTHLSRALGRWQRELIGLERPLIEANAAKSATRRS